MISFLKHNEPSVTAEYISKEFSHLIKALKDRGSEDGNKISIDELQMDVGKAYTKGLLYTDEVAVALTWFSKGSVSEKHFHKNSIEIIFIIQGEALVVFYDNYGGEEERMIVSENDLIRIDKGRHHRFYFPQETRILAKTVPADPTFPRP